MISEELLPAMQGAVPSTIVTCSLGGEPNTTVISQVFYVDENHVALSFQFFNKTIKNVRENRNALVTIRRPEDFKCWQLELEFEQSLTEGPVFDQMDMELEAIASMTGLSGVFKLQASDIYKVRSVTHISI